MKIGLIADTHGLLRPEALAALQGVDHLIHAGDIGGPQILAELEGIAPLSVVRGNNDDDAWADTIPERLILRFGKTSLYVLHDLKQLDIEPRMQGIDVVIAGHSHKPLHEERDGVLYLNPGSAGPRRFKLPISVALLHIDGNALRAELITLDV
ncbi:YfcE family phosphodiesterase [Pseudomonas daroniae]|uniref:Phosphoesterase n=1 Tax=Phytopseudomonas daroniae TaxID=2487519 RepID=A0A4Q9QKA2_9GAMM|nr:MULTISPECIES: metallophosphoesterase family protein [Pseudomonas]TBU75034.1 YfcE family phosphodiesterase [Pseudomonas daroniae]TBU75235.1 YfcE family phosphodiesterase [Pseudomonas daroniae]TBU80406.1 YfcE family phosphodiesterase [Pseudomonas sp. FRB 228]TBU89133.1 YfcE family phosphodiesterase [Pseudomonas daroniae]